MNDLRESMEWKNLSKDMKKEFEHTYQTKLQSYEVSTENETNVNFTENYDYSRESEKFF